MRKILFVVSGALFLVSLVWMIVSKFDYEPITVFFSSSLTLLGLVAEEKIHQIKNTKNSATTPNIIRILLDKHTPRFHKFLVDLGFLKLPKEYEFIMNHFRKLGIDLRKNESRNFIGIGSKLINTTFIEKESNKNFAKEDLRYIKGIRQNIKEIISLEKGGDGATAKIAALNRRSKILKNIIGYLSKSSEPIIVLGEPGSGKTKTMIELCLKLLTYESKKIFPSLIIYKRLGEFLPLSDQPVDNDQIFEFIKKGLDPLIKKRFQYLLESGRLVVLFDGMDEMSRQRYSECNRAFSKFATDYSNNIKSIFTCRINDFSPNFTHRKLVILPFNDTQIRKYIELAFGKEIIVDNVSYNSKSLLNKISNKINLSIKNPYILSLVCIYIERNGTLPKNRSELLITYIRYLLTAHTKESLTRDSSKYAVEENQLDHAVNILSKIAFEISDRNLGNLINLSEVLSIIGDTELNNNILTKAKTNRILADLKETNQVELIRFEHHRLQEFLTAYFVIHNESAVDWNQKLESLRWQETMFYLLEMDSKNSSVYALLATLDNDYKIMNERKEVVNTSDFSIIENLSNFEQNYSYKVELSSRILSIDKNNTGLNDTLAKKIDQSIDLLTQVGKPSTQVRMIWACVNTPNIEITKYIGRLLTSKIDWLRNQALIICTSKNFEDRKLSLNLIDELLIDYSNGSLYSNSLLYSKSIFKQKSIKNFILLFVSIIIFSMYCIVTSSIPLFISLGYAKWLHDNKISQILTFGLPIAILLISFYYLIKYSYRLWEVSSAITFILSFPLLIWMFYEVYLDKGIIAGGIGLVFWIAAIPAILLLFHTLISYVFLFIFSLVSSIVNFKTWNYFPTACKIQFEKFGFSDYKNFYNVYGWLVVIVIVFTFINKISPILDWVIDNILYIFNYVYDFIFYQIRNIYLPLILISFFAILNLFYLKVKRSNEKAKNIFDFFNSIGIFLIIFVLSILGIKLLFFIFSKISNYTTPVLERIGSLIGYAGVFLLIAAIVIPALSVLYVLFMKSKKLMTRFFRNKNINYSDKISFVKILKQSTPLSQLDMLKSVKYTNLNISNEKEFLQFLIEIESIIIQEEPVLSYYWKIRYEYETLITQNE